VLSPQSGSRTRRPRKLTPTDKKIWPTPSQGPSHDLTFEGERVVAIAGDWESKAASVAAVLALIVRTAPEVRTILHLGDLRYEAPKIVDGKMRSSSFLGDLDALLDEHGIDRLLLTPGNHDWWEQLHAEFLRHPGRPYRIATRIWALPRGFRFRIGSTEFMSFGGAASLDKGPGRSGWSEHEVPTDSEVIEAVKRGTVDVLLTHETPDASTPAVDAITRRSKSWPPDRLAASAASRRLITDLITGVQARLTFHGHMHVSGEAQGPSQRSIYSLNVAGAPGNVGLLDVGDQGFSWLPHTAHQLSEQGRTAEQNLTKQTDTNGAPAAPTRADRSDGRRDELTDDDSGRWLVQTVGSSYEVDLDRRTIRRIPIDTAASSTDGVVRPLAIVRSCVVGSQGRFGARLNEETSECSWQISGVIRAIERLS